jgi:hyperosmotically inducible periplasmic protein
MKTTKPLSVLFLSFVIAIASACSSKPPKAPDVTTNIRQALDQAGLHDVSVSQDRDKNVVNLTGNVSTDNDKMQAESIARSIAGTQVVANQIAVQPSGEESSAKKVQSDLDKAIDKNLDAKLVQLNLNHEVRYDVKNGVVTLKGDVPSQSKRASVEKVASDVPNVRQVVNKLEVKNQKATSTER